MNLPPIVSREEWDAAHAELLVDEKAHMRAGDALAARRRRMPRLLVDKEYRFEGPDGPCSLEDLFAGRRQLIVYRAFIEPGTGEWPENGCRGCSMVADHVGHLAHLNARDTTLVYVSRAAQEDLARMQERFGWDIPWYTVTDDFDTDFEVDEWQGHNVFLRDDDQVFRTYFVNGRGVEGFGTTWSYLDISPLGRQEVWEDSPDGYPQTDAYAWWNLNDEYENATVFEKAYAPEAAAQRGANSTSCSC